MSKEKPTLGFIGLGNMGGPMARNLVQAGYAVHVYDIDPDKIVPNVALGAWAAASPAYVVSHSEIVLTSLPYSHTFVDVTQTSLLPHAQAGQIFIDLGTVAVQETQRLALAFAAQGAVLLDVPVSGGPRGAQAGTLRMFGGGDQTTFTRVSPILEVLGDPARIVYCGKSGMGQVVKAVNQLGMGLAAAAALEAVALGVLAGADVDAIATGVGGERGWRQRVRDTAEAAVEGRADLIAVKFGQLADFLQVSEQMGFELPLTRALHEFGQDAEPCVMDANRLSPSFWRELQKNST